MPTKALQSVDPLAVERSMHSRQMFCVRAIRSYPEHSITAGRGWVYKGLRSFGPSGSGRPLPAQVPERRKSTSAGRGGKNQISGGLSGLGSLGGPGCLLRPRAVALLQVHSDRAISRRYRNRRIGEFLKELDLTEGRGTGIPKILRAMKANGSPPPEFRTDDDHSFFATILPIHPEAKAAAPDLHGNLHGDLHGNLHGPGISQVAEPLAQRQRASALPALRPRSSEAGRR